VNNSGSLCEDSNLTNLKGNKMSLQTALIEALDLNTTQQGILHDIFPDAIEPVGCSAECDCDTGMDLDFDIGDVVFLQSDLEAGLLMTVIGIDYEDDSLLVAMVTNGEYKETMLPFQAVTLL
jgi:hypothetical protein